MNFTEFKFDPKDMYYLVVKPSQMETKTIKKMKQSKKFDSVKMSSHSNMTAKTNELVYVSEKRYCKPV